MRNRTATKDEPRSVGFKGRAGRDRVEDELAAQEARRNKSFLPYRFKAPWKKVDGKKPKAEIIFLDNSLDDIFYLHIHEVANEQGKFGSRYEICVQDEDGGKDACPLCQAKESGDKSVGYSTYVMCLTVLDLTPYESDKRGRVEYSKKLFMVKGSEIATWTEFLERVEKKSEKTRGKKSIRGTYVVVSKNDQQDPSTGNIQVLDTDWYGNDISDQEVRYAFIKEKDIEAEYGHDQVVGDNKKVLKEADADIKPFDYTKALPAPDLADLARKYRIKSKGTVAGSQDDIDADYRDEQPKRRGRAERSEDEEDSQPRSSRRTQRAQEDEEPEEVTAVDDESDDNAPPPPRRTRVKEAHESEDAEDDTPKTRARSRKAIADEEQEPEDEQPRRRTSSRSRSPEPEEKPKGRKSKPQDDIDDEIPF